MSALETAHPYRRRRSTIKSDAGRTQAASDKAAKLQDRARRRAAFVAQVAEQLRCAESLSHEMLSTRCGLPLNYIRWAYPQLDNITTAYDSNP
jgi:hypothetical protein